MRWLQYEYRIAATNIMGHATVNSHPLFHDLTGMRNTHVVGTPVSRPPFTALGDVPMKDAGPGSGSVTKSTPVRPTQQCWQPHCGESAVKWVHTGLRLCARTAHGERHQHLQHPDDPDHGPGDNRLTGRRVHLQQRKTHLLWDQYFAGTTLAGHPPIRLLNTLEASAHPAAGATAGRAIHRHPDRTARSDHHGHTDGLDARGIGPHARLPVQRRVAEARPISTSCVGCPRRTS